MKIAICIPSTDQWRADFGMSVAGLAAYAARTPAPNGEPIELKIFNMRFAYVTYSRNCLFREALAWKADWILHVETDMLFPPDALHRLLEHDKDCVSLNVVQRRVQNRATSNKFAAAIRRGAQFTGMSRRGGQPLGLIPQRLTEVTLTSFCFVLVRAAMLRAIPPPWAEFRGVLDINSTDCELTIAHQGQTQGFLTDDYGFCNKLMQHGYRIHVDMHVSAEARHVGMANFGFAGPEVQEIMFST
jgi:hypothetical protein